TNGPSMPSQKPVTPGPGITIVSAVATLSAGFTSASGAGRATDAVLTRLPVKAGATMPVTWQTAFPPGGMLLLSGTSVKRPALRGVQPAPQHHLTCSSAAGKESLTRAPATGTFPVLVTVIV